MNALALINKEAKRLKSKNRSMSHTVAVKKASAAYRAGSLGKVKSVAKKKVKQTGTSNTKRDKQRKAKPPGKRRAKSGRVYTERRKNRSDQRGSITGMSAVPAQLSREIEQYNSAARQMAHLRSTPKRGMSATEKSHIRKQVAYLTRVKQVHRKNMSNLKRLI